MDFIINFRPESIDAMYDESLQNWVSLLRDRNVLVKKGRGIPRKRALKECLAMDDFKPLDPGLEKSLKEKSVAGELLRKEKKIECESNHSEKFKAEIFVESNREQSLGDNQSEKNEQNTQTKPGKMQDIQKAYTGTKKFEGNFDEDLNFAIQQFESICEMYEINL